MKNLLSLLLFAIVVFTGFVSSAKYENLDGTTANDFTVGEFPFPKAIVSVRPGVPAVAFFGSIAGGTSFTAFNATLGTSDEDSTPGVSSALTVVQSGKVDGAATSGDVLFQTGEAVSGTASSGNFNWFTGDVLAGSGITGLVSLTSGENLGTGLSGDVQIKSGDSAANDTGAFRILTGDAGSDSGNITLQTGTAGVLRGDIILDSKITFFDNSTPGPIVTSTFDISAGATTTDSITHQTGNQSATGDTGTMTIATGNSTASDSGDISIETGTAGGTRGSVEIDSTLLTVASDIVPDGDNTRTIGSATLTYLEAFIDTITAASPLTLRSVDETSAGATGLVTLESGANAGAGDSGDISLATGTVGAGTRGDILFSGTKADFTAMSEMDVTGIILTGFGFATTELDNLGATAVNADINPSASDLRDLGSASNRWEDIFADDITIGSASAAQGILTIQNSSSNNVADIQFRDKAGVSSSTLAAFRGLSADVGMHTIDSALVDANPTNDVLIETGDKTAGTGDSGAIDIITGTSAGGSRGDVTIDGNSLIVASDIVPDGDDTRSLGTSPALGFLEIFVKTVTGSSPLTLQTSDETAVPSGDLTAQTGASTSDESGNIDIFTGNSSTSSSGAITLQTGTAGTTRGDIIFDGDEADFTGMASLDVTGVSLVGFPAAGANTALSNLAATAVNTEILPDMNNLRSLGSASLNWFAVNMINGRIGRTSTSGQLELYRSTDIRLVIDGQNRFTPSGNAIGHRIFANDTTATTETGLGIITNDSLSFDSGSIYIESGENTAANALESGDVSIRSGDITNAGSTGGSGDINLTAGTVAGSGVRGDITFSGNDADFTGMATADFTGVTISGLPAAGANTALSNLAATAVNVAIIPDTPGGLDLGTAALAWDDIFGEKHRIVVSGTAIGIVQGGSTLPSGSISDMTVQTSGASGKIALITPDNAVSDASLSGQLFIETGNKSSVTAGNTGNTGAISIKTGDQAGTSSGDSGRILLETGTSTAGGRGNVTISGSSLNVGDNGVAGRIEIQTTVGGAKGEIQQEGTLPSGGEANFHIASVGNAQTIGINSDNDSNATAGPSGFLILETGNKTAGTGNSGNIILQTGTSSGGARGKITANSNLLDVLSGVATTKLVADPCGDTVAFPESTLFYNDTSDYYCFCDGAGVDVQMHSPATACF